jgi:hypothetical protein
MDHRLMDGIKKALDALFEQQLTRTEIRIDECASTVVAYRVPPNVIRIDIKP